MMLSLQRHVHDAIVEAVHRQYGLSEVPVFSVEVPPDRGMGDLAVTVAFQLARQLRKAPRAIAQELATSVGSIPAVTRAVAAQNGYLNIFLDRPAFLLARLRAQVAPLSAPADKAVVEHTAINPNKAAHVGHLRNAALGDTLARALRFRGTPVEVQNYIDDTGVQVADVVVGFAELEHRTIDEVRAIVDTTRFDYYCWDLYARVTEWYEADRARLAIREATLHALEKGGTDTAALGALIVDRIVAAHLKTMGRLNVSYDLLTHEGDILRLQFWARAFEILKTQGAVFLQTEGKLAGCWVMRIEEGAEAQGADGGESIEPGGESIEPGRESIERSKNAAREKVIVRSNGVVTYVGKDLANQFWKFGLLGKDFRYRAVGTQADGRPLWSTTSGDGDPKAPPFGHAVRIYNVIDSRQMYLQALLAQALRALGHAREAEHSIHFSYEMVALSHATARELGYDLAPGSQEPSKPFVEVSGRKGQGVKIDDLLDLLTEKASAEVAKRNADFTPDERRAVASQIAVAAIRYFMLKYSRGKMIVFDIEEALSFEGDSGPYLQYAVVRANNIFHKLREREGLTEADLARDLDRRPAEELNGEPSDLWALVLEAGRLDEIVDQAVRSLEFSVLAKYAFGLAQLFNAFYHRYPVINEEQADRKGWRAAGVVYFRQQLTRALDVMGIEVPVRM
ncbi:MAG: arginine--tRNA ligase [Vicinamibacterales bacterium]